MTKNTTSPLRISWFSILLHELRRIVAVILLLAGTGQAPALSYEVSLGPEGELPGEFFYQRQILLTRHEDSPDIAVFGSYAVAAWYIDIPERRMAWAYSINGGKDWIRGGHLEPLVEGHMVHGFPGVCVDTTGTFYLAVLYTGTYENGILGVLPIRFENGAPMVGDLKLQPQLFFEKRPRLSDLPRVTCDPDRRTLYLTYTFEFYEPDPWYPKYEDYVYFTRLTGNSWSTPIRLSGSLCNGARPIVGPDGELYVIWVDFARGEVVGRRSDDFGDTFGTEFSVGKICVNMTCPPGYANTQSHANISYSCIDPLPTFPSLAIDQSYGPRRGTLYAAWAECATGSFGPATGSIVEQEPNSIPEQCNIVSLGQDFSGRFSVISDGNSDSDYFCFEGIAGQTVWIEGDITGELCSGYGLIMPSGAVFLSSLFWQGTNPPLIMTLPETGNYQAVFGDLRGSSYRIRLREVIPDGSSPARDHRDVVMTSSSDGGLTWTPKVLVNDDPPRFDNFLPEVEVDGLGGVHVAWYDRRDDPAGRSCNVYWRYSGDGGKSFEDSRRLSDTTGVVRGINYANLGDYMGLAASGADMHVVWTQPKLNRADPSNDHDIHTRRVTVTPEVRVTNLHGTPEGNHVRLTWSVAEPDFVWKFEVERSGEGSGEFVPLDTIERSEAIDGVYSFEDGVATRGEAYRYRVRIVRSDGEVLDGDTVSLAFPPLPSRLVWRSTGPNPFSQVVTLELDAPAADDVDIRIFDLRGAEIRRLYTGPVHAGLNRFEWNGTTGTGLEAGSGVYFLEARSGNDVVRTKIIRTAR